MIIQNNEAMLWLVNQFKQSDQNQDGLINREEISSALTSQLNVMEINPAYLGQAITQMHVQADELLTEQDQDGDGSISLWEAMDTVKLVNDSGTEIKAFTQEEIDYIHYTTNTTTLFRLTFDDGTVALYDTKVRLIGLEDIAQDVELPFLPGVTFTAGTNVYIDYIDLLDNEGNPIAYGYISHANLSKETEINGKKFEGNTTVEFYPHGEVHTGHLAEETFIDGWWIYDTYVDGSTYEGEIELGWNGEVIRGVRTSIVNSAIEYVSNRLGISADGFEMQNDNPHDSTVTFSRTTDDPVEGQDCSCYASTPGYSVLGYYDEINMRSTGRISYSQQCVVENVIGEIYQVNNMPECTPDDMPYGNGMNIGSTRGITFLAGMGEVLDQSDLPSPAVNNSVYGQPEVCTDSSPEDKWNIFINDLVTNTQAQQTERERSDPLFWVYPVSQEDWMPPEGIIMFWSAMGNYAVAAAYIRMLRGLHSDYEPPFDENLAVSPNLQMMDEVRSEFWSNM